MITLIERGLEVLMFIWLEEYCGRDKGMPKGEHGRGGKAGLGDTLGRMLSSGLGV